MAGPIIDLTLDERKGKSIVQRKRKRATIDLSGDDALPSGDHMGSVAKMLRSDRIISPNKSSQKLSSATKRPRQAAACQMQASLLALVDAEYISSGEDEPAPTGTRRKRKPINTFPFLALAPEIRNNVYKLLLTRPPKEPIELPRPISKAAKARSATIRDCKTAQQRKAHKQLFLEILATCRQIHDEASGIMYGCNVFQYRPHLGDVHMTPMLPTRHLQLIKHVKVSVISDKASRELEKRISDFIACFTQISDLQLENFDLVWYAWRDCLMTASGPLNQALLSMKVGKRMSLCFRGQSRLQVSMKGQLEDRFTPAKIKVCIADESLTNDEVELAPVAGR